LPASINSSTLLASFTVLCHIGSDVFIKPNVDAGIGVCAEFAEGFEFQHAQEGRVFGVGLRAAFAFLQAFDFGFGLQSLDFGLALRGQTSGG